MILVLASEFDSAAEALVRDWPGGRATRLTPNDAASLGWQLSLESAAASRFVADGIPHAATEVEGLVTRMPGIMPRELYQIAPEDQGYAAAEITAMLVYWLNQLTCPVFNRPTPYCLAGPGWRFEQWLLLAHRCGIPVEAFTRSTNGRLPTAPPGEEVHRALVVGGRCVLGGDGSRGRHAEALAKAAGAGLLEVRFVTRRGGDVFHSVNLLPDLTSREAREALATSFGASES